MDPTTNSIETISNLEELERAERAQAELAARVAVARAAVEDKEREERELVQRKRWRELERQMQTEVQNFHTAREKAAAALIEHINAMYEAEQRWIALFKERHGVGKYAHQRLCPSLPKLLPYGEAVDVALALMVQTKQWRGIPLSDWG